MTASAEHHDLALMLLAGRSLPEGLPWSYDEDRRLVLRERALWAVLTTEEQAKEQRFLASLWREKNRSIKVNPKWGDWAKKHPTVPVKDDAFGRPKDDFRPYPKGPPVEDYPGYVKVIQWLWDRGFHVVAVTPDGWIAIAVPSHRGFGEADRLMGLLLRCFPHIVLQPLGLALGVQVRSVYDPVSGRIFVEVFGFDDFIAKLSSE